MRGWVRCSAAALGNADGNFSGLSEVMEAAAEGLVMAENALPIAVRIIVCGMRNLPSEVTEKLAQLAWRYRSKVIATCTASDG